MDDKALNSNGQKTLDTVSVLAFLIGFATTLWFPERVEPRCFFIFVLLVMFFNGWRSREASRKLIHQLCPQGSSLAPLSLFTAVAGVTLLVACLLTGAFRGDFWGIFDKSALEWVTVKLPTVASQQIMLQLLLAPILLRLFRKATTAAFVGASIFAFLHLPNPLLVCLTLISGVVWLHCFYRSQKLIPIVMSHALLAFLAAGFCGEYVLNMRVGGQCLPMLPQQVETETGNVAIYPQCLAGSAERLSQAGDQLIIEGWIRDCVHHARPKSLSIMVDGRLLKVDQVEFQTGSIQRRTNQPQAVILEEACYNFVAQIDIKKTTSKSGKFEEFQLYGINVNGNGSRLGRRGSLHAIDGIANHTVVLFPAEVDGRIDSVSMKNGQVRLSGWAADLREQCLSDQVAIELNGTLRFISLKNHRVKREHTAQALDDLRFLHCGFAVSSPSIDGLSLENARYFSVDQQNQLHRLHLTEQAKSGVAVIPKGNSDSSKRIR
jgi:hypothetical protein